MKKPNLLLVDDEALVRQGLKAMLEKQGVASKIYEAGDGQGALEIIQLHPIDIVLLDIRMPKVSGTRVISALKLNHPHIKIIVVTGVGGTELILNLLKEGVHGFVQKMNGFDEVLKSITVVMEAGRYFSEEVLQIIRHHTDQWDTPPSVLLNDRELRLLKSITEGLTTKQIADLFHLSPRTAETNRQRLLEKTRTQNTAALIAYAYRNGII